MRRFIFLCVALVALLATNASGTNYHPTDLLQTHFVLQPQVNFMAIVAEPQAWEFTLPIANKTQTVEVGITFYPEAFAWIDPGRFSYGKPILSSVNLIGLNKSNQIPNRILSFNVSNYNTTNYSYGLRY